MNKLMKIVHVDCRARGDGKTLPLTRFSPLQIYWKVLRGRGTTFLLVLMVSHVLDEHDNHVQPHCHCKVNRLRATAEFHNPTERGRAPISSRLYKCIESTKLEYPEGKDRAW
jgi:hypothetical protein